MANKVYKDAESALEGVLSDGMMVMCGGFGLVGIPDRLIHALRDAGVKNLTCVSNNAGIDGEGLGLLLETGQVQKMISSYVGENKTFAKLYLEGKLEIEFNPQGTLAERCRAGGAGIPAFYTKTGVGTQVAKGKETKVFDGHEYVMERGLVGDLALVKAWKGDAVGNLVYRKAARSEEHTSELQSQSNLVCRLLLEKKKTKVTLPLDLKKKMSTRFTEYNRKTE